MVIRYLLVTKCESVSPALEAEFKAEEKTEDGSAAKRQKLEVDGKAEDNKEGSGIMLRPKMDVVAKSAAQIMNEQRGK